MGSAARAAAVLVAIVVVLAGGAAAGAVFAGGSWVPPDDTITSISGTKMDGFNIRYYDGSQQFPPTSSEAIAECSEYDDRRTRLRCKVAVRTWYSALGDTKRALRYARTHRGS